jgi:hypothetical protein
MVIDIKKNEPGKGQGRGFKKNKTMEQLRTEINDKINAPKIKTIKKPNEQSQYVYSSSSTNSSKKN